MEKISFATRLYVSEISAADSYTVWYDMMPPARRERCDRFKNTSDKQRCVAAYALLVHALRDLLGSCEEQVSIAEGAGGKPYLTDIPVCFNISHSKDRVALALSPDDVGCDVEHERGDALNIAKRFFADEEYGFLRSVEDEGERILEFTRLWTLKEAVVKCCGEGIRHELGDFSLVDKKGSRKQTIKIPGFDEVYHIREFESENGYCYSVCSIYGDIEDSIRRVRLT